MSIFRADEEGRVRELLDALERPVELLVALGPEETPLPGARDVDFGAETQRIVEGIAALSDRVTFRVEDEPPGFERYPRRRRAPGRRGRRRPLLRPAVGLRARLADRRRARGPARPQSSLRPESLERLAALDRDLAIDVFVTPT